MTKNRARWQKKKGHRDSNAFVSEETGEKQAVAEEENGKQALALLNEAHYHLDMAICALGTVCDGRQGNRHVSIARTDAEHALLMLVYGSGLMAREQGEGSDSPSVQQEAQEHARAGA